MAQLCTAEYFKALTDTLNNNPDFREDAPDFTFKFLFGETTNGIKANVYFEGGVCTLVSEYAPGDEDEAGYIVNATRESWESIATGSLDAVKAILTGKLSLAKGGKMGLVKQLGAATELFATMKEIPFE